MFALFIISFGILSRLIVHTPNFTPILSMALLAGIYLKGRQAVVVPLVLMVISDFLIGFYGKEMLFTWAAIMLVSLVGVWLKAKKSLATVLGGSIGSALVFFIVSNLGSWLTLYPHTVKGLQQCYIMAIPFFRSSLISTVAYSLVFYAGYEWMIKRSQGTALARML